MHPLIVSPLFPPATGGAATYFGAIVPALLRRPEIERLTILTERLPGEPAERSEGKLRIVRRLPTRITIPRAGWVGHAESYWRTQLWFAMRLAALVRDGGVDVIHFHTRYRGRAVYQSLRRCRVPVIANLHDQMTDPVSLKPVADWLLCCAQGVQRFAIDGGFPADRTILAPLPFVRGPAPGASEVTATRRRYGLVDGRYLLFVGDITANKGAYELLQAYRQWNVDPSRARLVLAGTNWAGERFVREVQQTPGAIYLGPLPHEEVSMLIAGAEMVVLPSHSEGLPYVILEAVSLGVKVVAPPRIPEFERHLPEWTLTDVTVAALVEKLTAVWARTDAPSYPLAQHDPDHAAQDLATLYGRALRRDAG